MQLENKLRAALVAVEIVHSGETCAIDEFCCLAIFIKQCS